jgi:hypothetical protein
VISRGADQTRGWRGAVAAVAVLAFFAAVVVGWSSCGTAVAGLALPQAATSSHEGGERAAAPSQHFRSDSPVDHPSVKNAWMTRERPPSWPRLAPVAVWSLPNSLAAAGVPPDVIHSTAPAAKRANRDTLTQFCIARL